MAFKEKLVGILLIIVGVLPFLLKIEALNTAIGKYTWLLPGGIVYQAVIVVLGVALIWRKRPRLEVRR